MNPKIDKNIDRNIDENIDRKKAKRDDESNPKVDLKQSNFKHSSDVIKAQNKTSLKTIFDLKDSTNIDRNNRSLDIEISKNQSVDAKAPNVIRIDHSFDIKDVELQVPVNVEIKRPTEYPVDEENLVQERIMFDTISNLTENFEIKRPTEYPVDEENLVQERIMFDTTSNLTESVEISSTTNLPTKEFVGKKSALKTNGKLRVEESHKQGFGLFS